MLMVIVMTFILCLVNHTPAQDWRNDGISAVTVLYPIGIFLLFLLAYGEFPAIVKYRLDYWGFLGGIRGAARFDKYVRTLMTWSFIALCISKLFVSMSDDANVYQADDQSQTPYKIQDFQTVTYSLTICVMSCYVYMYYFLMGFDTSGPFVLTIYRIISQNIPYFLQFYIVILVSFGCALSLVTNTGNPSFVYGFRHLGLVIWTLVRGTVNLEPSNNELREENVARNVMWLYDLLITSYNILVVIIFLNLLIALISGKRCLLHWF
jgi:hypothetical protein